jgi:hypothetical protein
MIAPTRQLGAYPFVLSSFDNVLQVPLSLKPGNDIAVQVWPAYFLIQSSVMLTYFMYCRK